MEQYTENRFWEKNIHKIQFSRPNAFFHSIAWNTGLIKKKFCLPTTNKI